MGNRGTEYSRQAETIGKLISQLGGLGIAILAVFKFIDFFLGGPFRQLDLSVSFQKLKEINMGDMLPDYERQRSKDYIGRMTNWFYMRYWCLRRTGRVFYFCCNKDAKMT